MRKVFLTVVSVLMVAAAVAQPGPRRASGIDSLDSGSNLGGDSEPPATAIRRVAGDNSLGPECESCTRFTTGGSVVSRPRRGQVVIVRRRTANGYVVEKRIF